MTRIHRFFTLPIALLIMALPAAAQQSRDSTRTSRDTAQVRRELEQRVGRGVSQAEIIQRLRDAGLSRAEVRTRLAAAGYDPALADPYFDVMEGNRARTTASPEFITAIEKIGLSTRAVPDAMPDKILEDTIPRSRDPRQIFGIDLFRGSGAEFDPVGFGPVDPSYRLGPGDEIVLVLTGDVETAYPSLTVSREGRLVIPDVGSIVVNGLTLAQLEDVLYQRLGSVYSGISRSANATTRFQVSLGELRVNRVFVIGEVRRPASYQLSSVATTFHALYRAGGPNEQGSLRRIQINRGGRVVGVVDLYSYLMRGDATGDIRLEHNDRIFVPTAERHVRVEGAVRRPATYEVLETEGLTDVLGFAGGTEADAIMRHVQIDRILPAGQRTPGVNRVLIDVDLRDIGAGRAIPLQDGDVVHVFAVSDERRNLVTVQGEVFNPGLYEWHQGVTLREILARAEGLQDDAYRGRIHVYRLNPTDGSRSLVAVPVGSAEDADRLALADQDSIVVYSTKELSNPSTVNISGFVKRPANYTLAEGTTLRDLILIAGGFSQGAYVLEAEISRLVNPFIRTDTTAQVFRLELGQPVERQVNSIGRLYDIPEWPTRLQDVTLQHGDQVFIRRAPGFESPRTVAVTGEVALPGHYVLRSRDERLSDVIQRAGGITSEGNLDGLQVVRGARVIAGELAAALRNPSHSNNIVMEAADSIHIPRFDPTVAVSGAVAFHARVLYRAGKDLSYYIAQAGGYTEEADKSRVAVQYPNGERAAVRNFLLYRTSPDVKPGSSVFVPHKADKEGGFDLDSFLTRTLAVLGTLATVLIAVKQ